MAKESNKKGNEEINERLSRAIHAVIDQQIAENEPPETNQTLERLLEDGFTRSEAYILIGKAIGREVAEVIINGQNLNMPRFLDALEQLPAPFAKSKSKPDPE
ncbi:MAG: hypothetical protein GY786_22775 [Proteobacteria bacterium]|nr:hypothetical protein [Pseudomonadota bacterium]